MIKNIYQNALRFIGYRLLYGAVNLCCGSLKIKQSNYSPVEKLIAENKNFVLAFWHGTMLVPWYLMRSNNAVALVSKSKDGELLARVLRKWNYTVVRGSSHSDGSISLAVLIDHARNGMNIMLTPDGPKGPLHKFKAGAVIAAKRGGIPLIMAGVGYQKKRSLGSWDRFEIPSFFSAVNIVYSDPVYIDPELSYEETSLMIANCENKLIELHKKASFFL